MSPRLFAATLSPFSPDGRLDLDILKTHIEWLEGNGIHGFAPTGTTGEFLYLSWNERRAIHTTVLQAAVESHVIPCVWDPDPKQAVLLAQNAADEGAAAVFLPPPLFHIVEEDAVLQWYEILVNSCPIPVWAYHHPRTHNPISESLFHRLLEVGVEAIKDSSGDPSRVHNLCKHFPNRVWVGGESMLPRLVVLPNVAGHISRLANLYPSLALDVANSGPGTEANRYLEIDRNTRDLGGLPVVKARLGMGSRLPILPPSEMDLERLPDPQFVGTIVDSD